MEKKHTAFDLAKKVKEMRELQTSYFRLKRISVASKLREDAEAAGAVLIRSKAIEKEVDQMAGEILLAGEEEPA
jgi:hypothetical protein